MRTQPLAFAALAVLLLVSAGCNEAQTTRTFNLPDHPAAAADYTLTVEADREAAAVGDEVLFTVTLLDPEGVDVTAQFDVRNQLSPPLGVLADGDGVYRFTFVDEYSYFASVEIQGTTLVASDSVAIGAGAAADLSINAEQPLVEAGQVVDLTYEVTDAWGNPADGSVSWQVDPTASIVGDTVTAEATGLYTVTGTLVGTEATAIDHFSVSAAQPASLSVMLSSYNVEVGEGIIVTSTVLDAYGNEVEDVDVELSASPDVGVEKWSQFMRFRNEGIFHVQASIPAYSLTATPPGDQPVLVDSSGPDIRIVSPARGIEIPASDGPTVVVTGSVEDLLTGVMSVTVNGEAVSLAPGGLFTYEMTPEPGLNGIEILAVDGDNNTSDHYQSFLWGEFNPVGEHLVDGILARLNEGAIDVLEDMVADMITSGDLTAGLVGPLTNVSLGCLDLVIGSACADIQIDLTDVIIRDLDFDLAPHGPTSGWPDGYLAFAMDVYSPDMAESGFEIDINIALHVEVCVDVIVYDDCWDDNLLDVDAAALVDVLGLYTEVGVDVVNNVIEVDLANTDVTLDGFRIEIYTGLGDFDDFLNDIIAAVFSAVEPLVEGLLPPIMEAALPPLIEDVLSGLQLAFSMDLGGATLDIEALPQDVEIDDDGLTLFLESMATATAAATAPPTLGSWYRTDYSVPSYDTTNDFSLSLSDNFVNQLLHAVWQAGVLDLTMDGAELGLDFTQVQGFVPISNLSVETLPLLPPVVTPGSGGLMELNIGDMLVSVYGDPGYHDGLMMQLAISLSAEAVLSVDANDLINFEIANPVVAIDFVTTDPQWSDTLNGEIVEDLMDGVVDLIVPQLTTLLGGIGGIPIPELPGFAIESPAIYREADPIYYMTVGGSLVPVPAP